MFMSVETRVKPSEGKTRLITSCFIPNYCNTCIWEKRSRNLSHVTFQKEQQVCTHQGPANAVQEQQSPSAGGLTRL